MFLAFDGFHSPVLRSKSPGAQSVTIPWATGVLFRSDVPPHWFQSPGLIVGLWSAVSGLSFVAFSSAGFTPAGLASVGVSPFGKAGDRKSTRLNSSHRCISYAVFCLKKKKAALHNK